MEKARDQEKAFERASKREKDKKTKTGNDLEKERESVAMNRRESKRQKERESLLASNLVLWLTKKCTFSVMKACERHFLFERLSNSSSLAHNWAVLWRA